MLEFISLQMINLIHSVMPTVEEVDDMMWQQLADIMKAIACFF